MLQFLEPWRIGGLGPGCRGSLPGNVVGSINRTQAPQVSTKFGSEKAAGQDVRLTDLGTDGCIQVAEGLKNSQAQWEVGCVI